MYIYKIINFYKENDPLYEPIGKFLGLHAVVIVGYDDDCQCMDILNSHGVEFGNNGLFTLS